MNTQKSELDCLREVAQAARELESFLHLNAGENADWPIRLRCDNTESAAELAGRLNVLTKSLKQLRDLNANEY